MEEYLKNKISSLKQEIEKLENEEFSTKKSGYVTNYSKDSDLGIRVPNGKVMGIVSMSSEEIAKAYDEKESRLYLLRNELKQAEEELLKIEYNKPENVSKRQQKTIIVNREKQEQQLKNERLEHDERYEYLNMLVEYLKLAGLRDLAYEVSQMRFAGKNPKNDYIVREVDLLSKEEAFRKKVQTTSKEYRQIKKDNVKKVKRLGKDATRKAKKYKELHRLYINAREIVLDIKKKGLSEMGRSELAEALETYFTQPTGQYYFHEHGNNYSLQESPNLGYQYLEFYRDYGSKYNTDARKR